MQCTYVFKKGKLIGVSCGRKPRNGTSTCTQHTNHNRYIQYDSTKKATPFNVREIWNHIFGFAYGATHILPLPVMLFLSQTHIHNNNGTAFINHYSKNRTRTGIVTYITTRRETYINHYVSRVAFYFKQVEAALSRWLRHTAYIYLQLANGVPYKKKTKQICMCPASYNEAIQVVYEHNNIFTMQKIYPNKCDYDRMKNDVIFFLKARDKLRLRRVLLNPVFNILEQSVHFRTALLQAYDYFLSRPYELHILENYSHEYLQIIPDIAHICKICVEDMRKKMQSYNPKLNIVELNTKFIEAVCEEYS
jgi:hypothetical protein